MIKAAFFDVDGTLLSHQTNTVSESAAAALRALREKGILVFLATGRHMDTLQTLKPLKAITFDGAVTLNGQYCCNDQQVIYHNPVDPDDIAQLLSWLERHPMACGFIEEHKTYVNFHSDMLKRVHTAIHTPLPPLGDLTRGYDHNIYQVLLYGNDEQISMLPHFSHSRLTRWHNGGVDMIPAAGGKAIGIQKVLEHYGIAKMETIAFGDGENDIDMFHAVGTAVAMGNAGEQVKRESSYVTTAVDEDGIYNALVHLGII